MNILIVDDHPIFAEGLKLLLCELDRDLTHDDARNLDEAQELTSQNHYDLVLLDLTLIETQGLATLNGARNFCTCPIVVLSGDERPTLVRNTINCGAMGFIPKSSTPAVLIGALKLVLADGVYLPPRAIAQDIQTTSKNLNGSRLAQLTPKQHDVLQCLVRGEPNKIIARKLYISEGTVKSHLSTVLKLLGAKNRTEAVFIAAREGLNLTGDKMEQCESI